MDKKNIFCGIIFVLLLVFTIFVILKVQIITTNIGIALLSLWIIFIIFMLVIDRLVKIFKKKEEEEREEYEYNDEDDDNNEYEVE